ncbi:MAG: response regulator [Thermodesulfobacteriota bacterium]|nr:response regulator [Thermodesulfobacteriota bacterium]
MRKPPKILIIDDDPSICRMFKRFLTAKGYELATSGDSEEGLFLSRSEFFNVIILDICLPGMDGLALLSKIKSFSPHTEVIMITGHWNIDTAVQSFKFGAHGYLTKPIELDHLLQIVKKGLEKQALELEKRHLIAEINFKNILLEKQRDLLECKVIENDQRIFRLIKQGLFTKKLLEIMIESLPLGAMVIDKEGRFLICNKVQEMFYGLSRDSLLGKNLFQDNLPVDLKPWQEMAKDFLSSRFYKIKVVDQRPEKDKILSITLFSLIDGKGDSTGFIFLTADITNEKKIEEQIIQSEKMTAIGQLAANLAHQIRNPLAIIGSATQCCLEKEGTKNGLKKYFKVIYRNVQNANKIISDLLDFAKPKPLEFKKNDVNQILIELYRLLKMDFSKNRIRVLRRFDRYLPQIHCDKESLKQVFFNLLMNSKQAMPKGGTISIITRHKSRDQTAEIIIKDTGKGIPKEHIPNIFNPYFTTKEKGIGLGLSVVNSIISEHCGKIIPKSHEGKGTKMTITLPLNHTKFQDVRRENEQNSRCR